MQHLYGANIVALLSGEVEKGALDVASRAPDMKEEIVVVAIFDFPISQRVAKGGGKLRAVEDIYHKIPPLPPPIMCSRPVIFLTEIGHRPDQSHFLRPQSWCWRAHSIVRFPPPPSPPKSHETFCPPFAVSPLKGLKSPVDSVLLCFNFF